MIRDSLRIGLSKAQKTQGLANIAASDKRAHFVALDG
jgi:hypothetical protein